jgi:hypothetical protein
MIGRDVLPSWWRMMAQSRRGIEGRRSGSLPLAGRFQPFDPDAVAVFLKMQIGPLDRQRGDPPPEEGCRRVAEDHTRGDEGRLSGLVKADAAPQRPGRKVVEADGFFYKGQIPQQSRQEEVLQQGRQETEDGQHYQGKDRQRDAAALKEFAHESRFSRVCSLASPAAEKCRECADKDDNTGRCRLFPVWPLRKNILPCRNYPSINVMFFDAYEILFCCWRRFRLCRMK